MSGCGGGTLVTKGDTRMKRLAGIITAGFLTLTAQTGALAAEFEWKMATIAPESSKIYELYAKYFTDKVRLWSNGRLDITPYGAGVLAHPFKLYDAAQEGQVDMAWSYPGFMVNADPTNAIFAGFPGGMAPETFMHWVYLGGGQEMWSQYRRDKMGLMSLYMGQGTTEIFAHSHKPVRVADDLKGYKQRSTGAWADILEKEFGGSPTVTPFGEIFDLLQKKGMDGVEYGGPGANLPLGYHKVAKYIIFPGAHQPSSATEIFLSAEKWDSLPEDLQQIVRDAARATTYNSWMTFGHDDQGAMAAYRENGNELVLMDPSLVSAITGAGRKWIAEKISAETANGNAEADKIMKAYNDYQETWAKNAFTRAIDRAE